MKKNHFYLQYDDANNLWLLVLNGKKDIKI